MANRRVARLSAGAASYSANASGLAVDSDTDQLQLNIDGNIRKVQAARLVAAGSAKTLTSADAGSTILLDTAAGSTVTLPAAAGTGDRFRFRVSVLATSNSHIIKVANASDVMAGSIWISDTDTAGTTTAFSTAASSDTITLNRSTTGSVTKGEFIELEDIATNVWAVHGFLSNTASGATPFSATV